MHNLILNPLVTLSEWVIDCKILIHSGRCEFEMSYLRWHGEKRTFWWSVVCLVYVCHMVVA